MSIFANFRPIKNLPGLNTRYPGIDLIIVRENTEDLYAGLEVMVVPGVAQGMKIITEKASTRIAKFAFEYARKHSRKRIHSIHKANIMKLTDGLFLDCARKVAAGFPEVEYKEHIVDNTCMQLGAGIPTSTMSSSPKISTATSSATSAPRSSEASASSPEPTSAPSVPSLKPSTAPRPDIAGKDMANPTALLQSAILMLHHIDEPGVALTVQSAMEHVYSEGKTPHPAMSAARAAPRLSLTQSSPP